MDQVNSKKLYAFKAAVEAFLPYVRSIEDQMVLLDSKVTSLTAKRDSLQEELKRTLKDNDDYVAMEKEKAKKMTDEAKSMLEDARQVYLDAFKFKMSQTPLSSEELENKIAKIETKLQAKEPVAA